MSANLEVKSINKVQLREALEENRFWKKGSEGALSKNKAQWMLESPRMDEKDYCLFLGMADDQMVAFIHVIPDALETKDGRIQKVYWMIEWWVADNYESTVLGTYLFNEALRLMNHQVLIKAYAENVNEFYQQQPFTPLATRSRYTIFFSPNPDSLIAKFKFLKHFRFVLNLVDATVYKILAFLNTAIIGKSTSSLTYEYLVKLDSETWKFIAPLTASDTIHKSLDYINWQLDPKQYVQHIFSKKVGSKAHIRGHTDKIGLYNIKVSKENEVIGFFSFMNFNGEVYIKYFIAEEANYDLIAKVLMEHIIKLKASYVFTENNSLALTLRRSFKKVFFYEVSKTAIAHNELYPQMRHLEIKEQDGHFL